MAVIVSVQKIKNTESATDSFSYSDDILGIDVVLRHQERIITIAGKLKYHFNDPCDRCGEMVSYAVDTDFCESFTNLPDLVCDEPSQDCTPVHLFEGDNIDLLPYIERQAYLDKDMKVLCSPDCKGLCPVCGVNLNKGACTCETESIDPRLAALGKLLDN